MGEHAMGKKYIIGPNESEFTEKDSPLYLYRFVSFSIFVIRKTYKCLLCIFKSPQNFEFCKGQIQRL